MSTLRAIAWGMIEFEKLSADDQIKVIGQVRHELKFHKMRLKGAGTVNLQPYLPPGMKTLKLPTVRAFSLRWFDKAGKACLLRRANDRLLQGSPQTDRAGEP